MLDFNPRVTVLCGLNGTGKSSFVELLNRMQRFLLQNITLTDMYLPSDIPLWEQADRGRLDVEFGMEMEIDGLNFAYSLVIDYNLRDNLCRIASERLAVNDEMLFHGESGDATLLTDTQQKRSYPVDWKLTGLALGSRYNSQIRKFLSYIRERLFIVYPRPLIIKGFHEHGENISDLYCDNFSAWYDNLGDSNLLAVSAAIRDIVPVIPALRQFSLQPYGNGKQLCADIDLPGRMKHLPFKYLSDGQKVLVIYYIMIHQAPKNSCIIIDEFENYLSPVELQPIYNIIQDTWEQKFLQFILISHAERTLDWFREGAVMLKTIENEGNFTIGVDMLNNESGCAIDPLEALRSQA